MRTAVICALALGFACAGCQNEPPKAAPKATVFQGILRDILVPNCTREGCHSGSEPAGGMNLTAGNAYKNLVEVNATRRPLKFRVDPGHPEDSYLLERLQPGGDTPIMPFGGKPLPEEDLARIREWIRDGAKP